MKLLLLALSAAWLTCTPSKMKSDQWVSFHQVQSSFENPPIYFRPCTHWIWNGRITKDEIDFQLEEFISKGFGSLIIDTDRYSSGWYSNTDLKILMQYTKDRADSLGISVFATEREMMSEENRTPEMVITDQENDLQDKYLLKREISIRSQSGLYRIGQRFFSTSELDLSFQDMKISVDQSFARGINAIGLNQSLFTFPDDSQFTHISFSYHMPWWESFRYMTDYFSRVSLSLSAGNSVTNVLVLDPFSSYPPESERFDSFCLFLDTLDQMHIAYHLGTDSMIQALGSIQHTNLSIGSDRYSLIIIPPCTPSLSSSAALLLDNYIKSGGRMLSLIFPSLSEDSPVSKKLLHWSNEYESQFLECSSLSDKRAVEVLYAGGAILDLQDSDQGPVFLCRRQLHDGQMLFLLNPSKQHSVHGSLHLTGEALYQLDCFSGDISQLPVENDQGQIRRSVSLSPLESQLLFCATQDTFGIRDSVQTASDECKILPPQDKLIVAPAYYNSCILQGKTRFDKTKPASSETEFTFIVHRQVDVSSLMSVIQAGDSAALYINDHQVYPMKDAWLIDRGFHVYGIGDFVNPGKNSLLFCTDPTQPVPSLIYLYGDFSLAVENLVCRLNPPSPLSLSAWTDQGMPFYGEGVSYLHQYRVKKGRGRYMLRLGKWNGTEAEVRINGTPSGIIAFPPYSLDVTEKLGEGLNYIDVTVVGSLMNINAYFEDQSGSFYQKYGLFEDYQLCHARVEQP